MKSLYIIKAGSTFASRVERLGDFEDWIISGLDHLPCPIRVVDAVRGGQLPQHDECAGAVVTGSHAMVTDDLFWSLAIESWIRGIVESSVPFLGICYGHQLLGRATGGRVGYHPLGKEVGTVAVELTADGTSDALFDGVPERFPAHATHAQSVLQLPPGAIRLAGNAHEPNHAFRVGRCAWGVQFHPEYTPVVMDAYVMAQKTELASAGRDVDALISGIAETPGAGMVLKNFASLACRAI
jgi:GMP synthase (glutamine-hydrolysing)